MSFKATGKLPSGKHLQRLKLSPYYKEKGFENISETPMMTEDASYWKMIKEFFSKNKNTVPPGVLPSIKTNLKEINSADPVLVWFGHSSYFLKGLAAR